MKRRAVIIYCDNTLSGPLIGTTSDAKNLKSLLLSNLGGNWYPEEILPLRNPNAKSVKEAITDFCKDADYTLVYFSGHGGTEKNRNVLSIELSDCQFSTKGLVTGAARQLIILDACRTFYTHVIDEGDIPFIGDIMPWMFSGSTRELFDVSVNRCEKGITVVYSCDYNESSIDTNIGGAFSSSLFISIRNWGCSGDNREVLSISDAHRLAVKLMESNFLTGQNPVMQRESRINYFPIAVRILQ